MYNIGIISPSSSIEKHELEMFFKGIKVLEGMGFCIKIGKHVFDDCKGAAGSIIDRATDLNLMFEDKNIDIILSSKGGDYSEEILDYIDFDCIKNNKKAFVGFSDITVLCNAIYKKTGLVTYLGPDVIWNIGGDFSIYDRSEFINILIKKRKYIEANSTWNLINFVEEKGFHGKLFGGNLRCFLKLLDTDYLPNLKGGVLLIEDVKKEAFWFLNKFKELSNRGVFDILNGIIIGNNYKSCFPKECIDILINKKLNVLKINEFGHNSDHSVFPIGQEIVFNLENDKIVSFYNDEK